MAVERPELSGRVPAQQHELGLDAHVHRHALLGEPRELALQRDARAVRIGLALDRAVAHQARVTRHPGNGRERRKIADGHVVRPVRAHAETPEREARESRAIGEHHLEMLHRHGLGLRGAVDVDELREHELDLVLREQCLRFGYVHWFLPGIFCTTSSSVSQRYVPNTDRTRFDRCALVRLLLWQHQHADADHQRHDDGALPDGSAAKFTLQTCASTSGRAIAAEHEPRSLRAAPDRRRRSFAAVSCSSAAMPAASPRSSMKNSVDPSRPTHSRNRRGRWSRSGDQLLGRAGTASPSCLSSSAARGPFDAEHGAVAALRPARRHAALMRPPRRACAPRAR